MNASRRFLVSLTLALPLAGCGSLLNVQRTPFTTYSPQLATPEAGASGPRVDWQLIIETPLASTTLDTARIAVMPSPGVIEIFPGARWSDTAPSLLRSLVVEGFERSGRIVGVGSAASGMRADYALAIELRDFQLELDGDNAHAVIRFQARLLDYTSNRVLASQAFAASAPAASTDAASAFAAFEAGLNTVVSELIEWTLREGSVADGAHSRPQAG
jgi:cholesterol transport system auxiliary component